MQAAGGDRKDAKDGKDGKDGKAAPKVTERTPLLSLAQVTGGSSYGAGSRFAPNKPLTNGVADDEEDEDEEDEGDDDDLGRELVFQEPFFNKTVASLVEKKEINEEEVYF